MYSVTTFAIEVLEGSRVTTSLEIADPLIVKLGEDHLRFLGSPISIFFGIQRWLGTRHDERMGSIV